MKIIHLTSIEALRDAAGAWDDLWQRSDVPMPTLRAELIAQWLETFAPRKAFHALAVEDGGQWVAALPLVGRRLHRVIAAGGLPANPWSASGELLADPQAAVDAAMDAMIAGMRGLPWQLVWLDDVALETPRWLAWRAAAERAGFDCDCRTRLEIGRLEIDHDWEAYRQRWSRKHRQNMARCVRRWNATGQGSFTLMSNLRPTEVRRWLREAFEVEDSGWKGRGGTSVLRKPGMFAFFVRQAEELARRGYLDLAFLREGVQPVAFAYAMTAKGVYHSYKVGFDPRYADYSPGQLLRHHLFERFYADPARRAVDYMPPSEAHRQWQPTMYPVGRVAVATRGLVGRVLWPAYRCWRDRTAGAAAQATPV